MNYRLDNTEYDIVTLLQHQPEGLCFSAIVRGIRKNARSVYDALKVLREENHVSLLQRKNAQYAITTANKPVRIQWVRCPVCFTTRRIHSETQSRATCANPNCRTPDGSVRQFEILSRELLKKGIRQPVHRVT